MSKPVIYTIGHSTRTLDEFLDILRGWQINLLVDVRRFPTSSRHPHFNRDSLEVSLPENGIQYLWLGDLLGGFRRGGYENFTKTETFQQGLQRIITLSESSVLAIMCAEALWFRCHRRFIANALCEQDVRVIHIFDHQRTSVHKLRRSFSSEKKLL